VTSILFLNCVKTTAHITSQNEVIEGKQYFSEK